MGVSLKPAGRTVRGRLGAEGLADDLRFTCTKSEEFNLTAVHDGTYSHGERAVGHKAQVAEEDRVVAAGDLIEVDAART
jgi:hypothetical protein